MSVYVDTSLTLTMGWGDMGPPSLLVIRPQLARVEPRAGVSLDSPQCLAPAPVCVVAPTLALSHFPHTLPQDPRHQVAWHVSPHTCLNITRVPVAHNSWDTEHHEDWRLVSPSLPGHRHSPVDCSQCQGPRPPAWPQSPVFSLSHPVLSNIYPLKKI